MVGRLKTSNAALYDAFGGSFGGVLSVLNAVTPKPPVAQAMFVTDDKYKDLKPEDAVSEQPETLPEVDNLVFVSPPDSLRAGVMYYVAKVDGKEVVTVVSLEKTPGLYDWAVGTGRQFSEKFGSFVDGEWTVKPRPVDDVEDFEPEPEVEPDPDPVDDVDPGDGPDYSDGGKYKPATSKPDLLDIKIVGQEKEFPDAIRYEIKDSAKDKYGGETFFYATKADNPDIYAAVVDASKVFAARQKFHADGYKVADDKTVVPHLTEIKPETIKPVEGVPNSLTFEMKNGDKYFVNEDFAPSLYSKISSYQKQTEALEGIDAPQLGAGAIYNQHITNVELNNDGKALPTGMVLVTLKGHPTFGDGTYLVTEAENSQSYDTALSWYQNGSKVDGEPVDINGNYNDINYGGGGRTDAKEFEERFDISRADWDVMSALTGERVDAKDDKSRMMTVGELSMKKLREKFEKEAENDPDGKAAKFISLLDAVAAYSSGRPIQAYQQGTAVSSISGEYYVPSEDWQGVIDYDKLMAESNAIWQDPEIQKAYTDIIGEVIGGLDGPSMEDRAKKIYDIIVGDPSDDEGDTLALWLGEMKEQGRGGEAELIVQGLWSSLAFLDKPGEDGSQNLVDQAMNEFQIQALMVDLGGRMEEGIGEDAYSEAATQSQLQYILTVAKASPNLLRLEPNALNYLEGVVNGKISIKTATQIFSAIDQMQRAGVTNISQAEIDKLLNDKVFAAPGEKEGATKFINAVNKVGLLGTLVGGISLASGVTRLTQTNVNDLKPEDVMLITRDFLSFLSFSEHYAKGIASGVNSVAGLFGKQPNLVAYFGLNSTLPEIWGNDGRWGKKFSTPQNMWGIFDELSKQANTTLDSWATESTKNGFLNIDSQQGKDIRSEWVEHFEKTGQFGAKPEGLGGKIGKTVGSVLKVLSNGLDAPTGVIDIVFNSLKLSKSKGDPYSTASGAFGLIGGVANTAAGGIVAANALFRTLTFATVSSPLFIVGTILGVVSALIELLAGQRDTDKKLDNQREWLNGLGDAGVMQEDWGKSFEFINTWYAYAKGRNDLYAPDDAIPNGLSIFDYDRPRWDRFKENWEPGELPRDVDNFFNKEEERAWWANEDQDLVFDWKFSEDNHNSGNKISPEHPAAKEHQDVLNGLADWYTDNIDLTQKPVQLATFGNSTPKKAIEEMADFYLTYINSHAKSEDVADWIRDELVGRLPSAYDNAEEGERAAGAVSVHFDKHGGKDTMIEIIDGTLGQTASPRADFENTLNSIASIYASKGIDKGTRSVYAFNNDTQPIKPLFVKLIEYYFKEVKLPSGEEKSAEKAASWAIDEIKGRIGIAFQADLDSDDKDTRNAAKEKIEIFMNYVNKKDRSGKSDAEEVAREVAGKS